MHDIHIYFDLEEIVCKHVFQKYGQQAWSFFDPRLLDVMYWIREKLNKPLFANNYQTGGQFDERGIRCNMCELVREKSMSNIVYMSPHIRGQAIDFDAQGMMAEEVRIWIASKKNTIPYPVRLEKNVNWVHLDVANDTNQKVYLFNP